MVSTLVPVPAPDPLVRPATPADAPAVAEVRVRGWQRAYAGIVPDAYLASMDVAAETARVARRLGDDPPPGTASMLVAVDAGGAVVGFVVHGPYRDDDVPPPEPTTGEVYAIYVHPDRWGEGAGRALLTAALDALGTDHAVALWVLADNAAARAFYDRQGFAPDGAAHTFTVGGADLHEVRYVLPGRPQRRT